MMAQVCSLPHLPVVIPHHANGIDTDKADIFPPFSDPLPTETYRSLTLRCCRQKGARYSTVPLKMAFHQQLKICSRQFRPQMSSGVGSCCETLARVILTY